jgi:hypothetical protein
MAHLLCSIECDPDTVAQYHEASGRSVVKQAVGADVSSRGLRGS